MKHVSQRARQAFTLIELLVVIAIIGVLAAMITPAISAAKVKAQKAQAKMDINALMTAITQYQAEYSRLPATKWATESAAASVAQNNNSPDYTFGTFRANGSDLEKQNGVNVPTKYSMSVGSKGSYLNCNAELMDIMLGSGSYPNGTTNLLTPFNPRKTSFFSGKMVKGTDQAGLSMEDHVLRDPWGNPYVVTLDLNYDEQCIDAVYGSLKDTDGKGNTINGITIKGPAMIWSFGPDGKFDPSIFASAGVNKDNVLSWK